MFKVPQRPAAVDRWLYCEVIRGRWRGGGPLQRPRVPGVVAGNFPAEVGADHVEDETANADYLKDDSDADDQVPHPPTTGCIVGINAPRHTQQAWDVHEVEGEMEADQEEPEMPLAQCLAHHPARHLGIPVVKRTEKREHDGADQDIVEVCDHKVGSAHLPLSLIHISEPTRQ